MSKKHYVLYACNNNSGGMIAVHTLCKLLSDHGESAKIFYTDKFFYKNGMHLYYWIRHYCWFFPRDLVKRTIAFLFGEEKIKNYHPNTIKGCKKKFFSFVGKNTIVIYPDDLLSVVGIDECRYS